MPNPTLSTTRNGGQKLVENKQAKILWDFPIQTGIQVPHNKPDIILIDRQESASFIIAVFKDKERDNIDKYQLLKIDLEKLWKIKIMVIPVVIGALGAMRNTLTGWLAQIPGRINELDIQKSALLVTAKILRCVLRLPGLW